MPRRRDAVSLSMIVLASAAAGARSRSQTTGSRFWFLLPRAQVSAS